MLTHCEVPGCHDVSVTKWGPWSGARDRIGLRVRLLEIDRLLDRMALAERPLPPGGKP